MDATKLPILVPALRRWGLLDQQTRREDDDAMAKAAAVTYLSLARVRRRCRILNDAYAAAENKPAVRMSIVQTLGHLRELHARLPARLREKSWILAIEYCNDWILEARKSA
jgi:hypothetical protein